MFLRIKHLLGRNETRTRERKHRTYDVVHFFDVLSNVLQPIDRHTLGEYHVRIELMVLTTLHVVECIASERHRNKDMSRREADFAHTFGDVCHGVQKQRPAYAPRANYGVSTACRPYRRYQSTVASLNSPFFFQMPDIVTWIQWQHGEGLSR